jgi:hypothetical protein
MITLDAAQLKEALEFINPDGDSIPEQLETELTFIKKDKFLSSDGEECKPGIYCFLTEYPDEGLHGPLTPAKI